MSQFFFFFHYKLLSVTTTLFTVYLHIYLNILHCVGGWAFYNNYDNEILHSASVSNEEVSNYGVSWTAPAITTVAV